MADRQRLVLVVGATGNVGRHVVESFIRRNKERPFGPQYVVRLLVRDVHKATNLLGLNSEERSVPWIQLLAGDVLDKESLTSAMNGVDYVICTIGAGQIRFWLLDHLPGAHFPVAHPKRIDYEGVKNVVDTARDSGTCKRLVVVSSLAVTRPWFPIAIILNSLISTVLAYKLESERYIRESGLEYTIIRPGGLIDANKVAPSSLSRVIQLDQGDRISGRITVQDVAEIAIKSLIAPSARNATFECIAQNATGRQVSEANNDLNAHLDGAFTNIQQDVTELPRISHTLPLIIVWSGIALFFFWLLRLLSSFVFGSS
eukprot:TRINITY_DN9010_c0_g1_i1.p1 TRINITY_DN9010_c0_g1~~TRINITY_DN9010_c0_g1_i1.p1  ORF type:complete len:315 (+),score=35.37 TRINITY_DN9010_c0_g1_i1:143-1087(+)